MTKIWYEVDPHNRLIIKKSGRKTSLATFRTCVEGRFKIDGNNSLFFYASKTYKDIPQQIKLQGKWSIDKEHNLVFTLNKWGNQVAGNKLTLTTEINSLDNNEISFTLATREAGNKQSIYLLRLGGVWQADERNKLMFAVEKDKEGDEIKFLSSWQLKNNRIIYTYYKNQKAHSFTLLGYWNIQDKCRLSYTLEKNSGSEFNFRTSVGIPVRKNGRDGIKYELGVGYANKRLAKKEITIFGKWQLKNGVGLIFEVEYENGLRQPISFSATAILNNKYSLTFKLQNSDNENLGIVLQLSRKILESGEGFIKFLSNQEERAVQIGLGFRW